MKKKYLYLRQEELKGKKDGDYLSYRQLVDHYLDGCLILNNEIIKETWENGYWQLYNGTDYDEENDYDVDIYQYFIIDSHDAERLAEDTDEIIYYNEKLDLFVLGVTHFGTLWDGVITDYKITTNYDLFINQQAGA